MTKTQSIYDSNKVSSSILHTMIPRSYRNISDSVGELPHSTPCAVVNGLLGDISISEIKEVKLSALLWTFMEVILYMKHLYSTYQSSQTFTIFTNILPRQDDMEIGLQELANSGDLSGLSIGITHCVFHDCGIDLLHQSKLRMLRNNF